jgi:predicted O-linked N-acetylglucosamine transferase (SPINDLY family)
LTEALFQQALALHRSGRHDEAERLYREVLAAAPRHFDALHMLGVLEYAKGELAAAVASIHAAIAVRADFAPAYVNLGLPLQKLGRTEEAIACYDRALALAPGYAEAHYSRGNALLDLKRLDDAVESFDRALALAPGDARALYNRGLALFEQQRLQDAVASFDRALEVRPGYTLALYSRAVALQHLRRAEDVAATLARLVDIAPDFPYARGMRVHATMQCCDWTGVDVEIAAVDRGVRAGSRTIDPFAYQGISESPVDLRRCAEIFATDRAPPAAALWNGEVYDHAKIRIGYVSGEFRHQATAVLITELFELHDRSRFELIAVDNGFGDGSALRSRIERAFGEILDITRMSDRAAATAIRAREIDVLVNLNGYFGRERQRVFAHRPAPIQVNYLGFPGTLGAPYIDYIVADAWVIPPGHDAHYSEKVVRLPDAYQVNDRQRAIAPRTPSRADAGLPDAGFVFCCFNNSYKIAPRVFTVWMRLLAAVPGSVLWLLEDNAAAVRNLRREARARGVAPERLVFAPRVGSAEHLARHRLADLFVDTLPSNAHTTASDALWAGLPLLTSTGGSFAGRVATSLLHAAGVPELVTESLDAYETRALELAAKPEVLANIRVRLAQNRTTAPLFDTERFRRHLEAAWLTMVERHRRGEPPASFAVPPTS